MEIAIQQIRIGSCFLAAMNESLAADFGQQTVFVHDAPNCLVIVMLTVLTLDPKLNPTTAICAHILPTVTTCLNLSHQKGLAIWLLASLSETVISAAWYIKETAHRNDRILGCISLYHRIFDSGSHFLSAALRKSRSNSFSIRSCFTSFSNADSVVGICFAGFPRRFGILSCSFRALRLGLRKHSLTCSFVNPNFSPISRQLWPSWCICSISS